MTNYYEVWVNDGCVCILRAESLREATLLAVGEWPRARIVVRPLRNWPKGGEA